MNKADCAKSRRAPSTIATVILLSVPIVGMSGEAFAYRPFDGTDAAVVDLGKIEIELGPLQYRRQASERTLISPQIRINYGFAEGWEAVVEGQGQYGLSADSKQASLVDDNIGFKAMLREGSLQDKIGPSVATEFAVLLPGINDESGVGFSLAGIVTQQWSWMTVHFNAVVSSTRQHRNDVFLGAIIEGPHDWPVRPVAEILHEREFGRELTTSGLIGAIWHARDALDVDFALRRAWTSGHAATEVRAGLTFSFPVR